MLSPTLDARRGRRIFNFKIFTILHLRNLTIPRCKHWVGAGRVHFDLHSFGSKTWCGGCKKSWFVRYSLCRSGSWHKCERHTSAPEEAMAYKESAKASTACKRKSADKPRHDQRQARRGRVSLAQGSIQEATKAK